MGHNFDGGLLARRLLGNWKRRNSGNGVGSKSISELFFEPLEPRILLSADPLLLSSTSALALIAGLEHDTASSAQDQFTNNTTITGSVTDTNSIVRLSAALDAVTGVDLTSVVRADGSFKLTASVMQGLAGGPPAELHPTVTDKARGAASRELSFILDSTAPSITAHDTSASPSGALTDPIIIGKVADLNGIAMLKAAVDEAAPSDITSLLRVKQDGSFELTHWRLRNLAGGTLAEGAHTLHLTATDKAGNVASFDLSFVLGSSGLTLTGKLIDDSGSSGTDRVTRNPAVVGNVTGATAVTALRGALDGAASMNLISLLQADGSFTLTSAVMQNLAAEALSNGEHTLRLSATDAANTTAFFDLTFTLDTVTPIAPVFDLALASDTSAVGDHITEASAVTLQGVTEPHALVTLIELGLDTLADSSGAFRFENIALALGTRA
jgi:hypothetical protein